ncbi:MAG: hypothetical protein KDA84_03005 [Planctomycetaceae bacterium]|nr:hypothetical protein [Planctomycetaceae bacterium]
MSRNSAIRGLMIVGVLALVTSPMWAQTGSKTSSSKSTTTKTTASKFRGRLPNNFRQLGLSEKQIEDIYIVQKKYYEEIEELEKRLKALEEQEDQEIHAILTAEQKTKLEELRSKFRKPTSKSKTTGSTSK